MLKHITALVMLLCALLAHAPVLAAEADYAPSPAVLPYLQVRYAAAGRWSADSQWIAFTTNWTGSAQKWRIPAGGGFPRQITFFEDAIDECAYSPVDPGLMVCQVDAGGNERGQLFFLSPDGSGLEPFAYDPAVIHRLGSWSRDGGRLAYVNNARDSQFFDVYIYDVAAGESERVLALDAYLGAGSFSPDGSRLLVSEWISNFDNKYHVYDLATGETTLLTPHHDPASYVSFNWADNGAVYFISDSGRDFRGIARMEVSDPGNLEWVHTPEREIEGLSISDDGRYIAWSENADGFGVAHIANLPEMAELPAPDMPAGVQSIGSFDPASEYLLLQVSGPQGPTDLYKYELASGETTQLTWSSTGGIDPDTFVQPQLLEYEGFDGLRLGALLYEPPGEMPAGGWPMVVWAHGGPESQSRPLFSTLTQLLLSRGIAVLRPNPRGSSGYGRAFKQLDNIELREDSVADYKAARDMAVALGIADSGRIAIRGGSYGGYVVLAALALYPDDWAAGVCNVGISNFVTFLENTAPHRRSVREAEYGFLATDREFMESISPLNRVDSITAPLLLVHGANDPRVPVTEAYQIHDALEGLGREVEILVFEDEGHGVVKDENRAVYYSAQLGFLEKHLGLAEE